MTREDWDQTWLPMCVSCPTMERMNPRGIFWQTHPSGETRPVQYFRCIHCGARHRRWFPSDQQHEARNEHHDDLVYGPPRYLHTLQGLEGEPLDDENEQNKKENP